MVLMGVMTMLLLLCIPVLLPLRTLVCPGVQVPRIIKTSRITQPHHHVVAGRIDVAVHDLAAVRAVLHV